MTSRSQLRSLVFLSAALLFVSVTRSADSPKISVEPRAKPAVPEPQSPRTDIRVDTNVVLIPVAVTDPIGKFVVGLEKDNFRLFEDKVEQQISSFASEDAPISVGLVFDTSGSMENKLGKSREAVVQFIKTANPGDEFALVEFNDRPELVQEFTTSLEEIQNRLMFAQTRGRTALLDAVYMSIHRMKKARHSRKALLVISDGGDNSSRYTETEIKNRVREADVQIYAIGIVEPISSRGRTAEELNGPGLLNQLAEETGGRHFLVENLNELPDIAAKIGTVLRNQYLLGYSPANHERDGRFRRVTVRLTLPKHMPPLKAFFRPGYYAPVQ